MNDAVAQMKSDVSALMSGGKQDSPPESNPKPQENNADGDANNAGGVASDSNGTPNDSNSNNDSGDNQPQLSERQQRERDKAVASGWKPKDNFKGDAEDFVEPREWNRTVALYRRIDREANERKRLEKEVGTFGDRVKNVMEVAKAQAIRELETKKQAAVEEADYKEVQRIDKEISDTNETFEVEAPDTTPAEQSIRPEVEEWMDTNPWFDKNEDMQSFALSFQAAQLSQLKDPTNPSTAELSKALKRTTSAVRNEFPGEFKRQPRAQAPSLEGGNTKPKGKKFTYNDLTNEEKTVLKEVERLGGMSRDDYIQAIADTRGAK